MHKKHRNRLSSSGHYFSTPLIDKSQIQVLYGLLEPWKRYISIRKYISTTDTDMALHQWVSANDTVLDRVRLSLWMGDWWYSIPPPTALDSTVIVITIMLQIIVIIIKSPQYTGGDFMFLYRFVRCRRRRRPQILVHAKTFEQLLGFLSFLAQLLALTCRLPDYIFVDFRRDLDLDFSRSNMEFAISQPKMVRLPRNEKQT